MDVHRTAPRASVTEHGCDRCRDAFGPEHWGTPAVPPILVPAARFLGVKVGEWAERFRACTECGAWWRLHFDPKDLMTVQTAVDEGIEAALPADASLADVWPYLLSAEVRDAVLPWLRAARYEPQPALEAMLELLLDGDLDVEALVRVVRAIDDLLAVRNPCHREWLESRGWLFAHPSRLPELEAIGDFERRMHATHPGFARAFVAVDESLAGLRRTMDEQRAGRGRLFRRLAGP